jgi:hypothetical protein
MIGSDHGQHSELLLQHWFCGRTNTSAAPSTCAGGKYSPSGAASVPTWRANLSANSESPAGEWPRALFCIEANCIGGNKYSSIGSLPRDPSGRSVRFCHGRKTRPLSPGELLSTVGCCV